jgi:hypothetical protein
MFKATTSAQLATQASFSAVACNISTTKTITKKG